MAERYLHTSLVDLEGLKAKERKQRKYKQKHEILVESVARLGLCETVDAEIENYPPEELDKVLKNFTLRCVVGVILSC